MNDERPEHLEERVLVLAPTARDGATSQGILEAVGVRCFLCGTIEDICREAGRGAGAAVVTAEAVLCDKGGRLSGWLKTQPPWSDFPLVVLSPVGAESPKLLGALEAVGHMTLMKRPVQISTLVSTVRSALRDRRRQYAVRDLLEVRIRAEDALREAHEQLETRVQERTAELARVNEALTAEVVAHRQAEAARQVLLRRLAAAQEEERHRLARELHDEMGQHLTALSLGLKALHGTMADTSSSQSLQQLQELAALMGREIHQLALDLRPTALDDLGLHTALINYLDAWSERSRVEVDFQGDGLDGDRLPPLMETTLYRVMQEALTNVLKHAGASRVSLILQRTSAQVLLVVEDDGHGFDVEAMVKDGGVGRRLGLLGMRERLALVHGTLTIESTPQSGTTVFARIPLPMGRKDDVQ